MGPEAVDVAFESWLRVQPFDFPDEAYQAARIISVQCGTSLSSAFVRLQARAHGEGRLVGDLAAQILTGKLRFGTTTGQESRTAL